MESRNVAATFFLRNQLTFWSSHPSRGRACAQFMQPLLSPSFVYEISFSSSKSMAIFSSASCRKLYQSSSMPFIWMASLNRLKAPLPLILSKRPPLILSSATEKQESSMILYSCISNLLGSARKSSDSRTYFALIIMSCCHTGKSSRSPSASAAESSSLDRVTSSPVFRLRNAECSSLRMSISSTTSFSETVAFICSQQLTVVTSVRRGDLSI